MSKHTNLIKKIITERHEVSELSTDTLKSYSKKAGDRINAIKAKGWKKTSADAKEMLHLDKNKAKAVSKINSKTPATKTGPAKPQHDKEALTAQLKSLKKDFDPAYQHSDDHSVYTKHRDIHAKITDIEKKLKESTDIDEAAFGSLKSLHLIPTAGTSVSKHKGRSDFNAAMYAKGIKTKKQTGADAKVYHIHDDKVHGIWDHVTNTGVVYQSSKNESEQVDELSKDTLGSYIGKADKEVHDLNKKSTRSKNLQRAYDLLGQAQKRRKGSNTAVAKLSKKLAGERWGIKEENELDEAGIVVHSSKEKDGKEYQVLSRKNNREFVIQSKKKDGSWQQHDAVGQAQRARQLITTGRYSSVNEAMKVQEVQITIPALIRLCEIAREDMGGDTDLHEFIEALIENSNGTIDSQSIENIEGGDGDDDADDASIKEGEIVQADKKVGNDGRLYPRSRKTLGKATGSLTGATT